MRYLLSLFLLLAAATPGDAAGDGEITTEEYEERKAALLRDR